jgi:hypothetical protein
VTIKCVCDQCNNGWMSDLEGSVKPFVGAMIHDIALTLTIEHQKLIAVWTTKMAMVLKATIRHRGHQLYSNRECERLRLESAIPDRSLIWLGRISDSGLFASGTHVWLKGNFAETYDGQVSTFTVGHLAIHVLTIHVGSPNPMHTICRNGPWDESLLGIYPANQTVTWPPHLTFGVRGPLFFASLRDRWKIGRKR